MSPGNCDFNCKVKRFTHVSSYWGDALKNKNRKIRWRIKSGIEGLVGESEFKSGGRIKWVVEGSVGESEIKSGGRIKSGIDGVIGG